MRHFLLVTLFFCLFPVHPICADDKSASPDTLTIVASGTGTNEDGAIRQALKNAVQQAVGIIIDAETIVKNDQIIKDEILTATQAIVTKYNPVGKPLIEAGLVTVTIKATVERRGLLQRLEKASVVSRAVEGKDLFAQAVTELEKEQDAAKIVKRVFQDFPGNVLAAEPFGKPRIIEKTSAFVTMGVTVRFSVDREKYKRWYDNFVPILAKVATKSGELRWNPIAADSHRYADGPSGQSGKGGYWLRSPARRYPRFVP